MIRRGEIVFSLDDGPRLQPASGWNIRGTGPDSKLWTYRLDFSGPSGTTSAFLPSDRVVHIRVNLDPARPWAGRAPYAIASATAKTAASTERAAFGEASIPTTRIAPIPSADGRTEDRLQGGPEKRRGGHSPGRSTGGALPVARARNLAPGGPRLSFVPSRAIRSRSFAKDSADDVLNACGIPTALFNDSEGSSKREAYRQFIFGALEPWAAVSVAELREKIASPELLISFAGLHGADLATRGRALKQLVDAGVDLAEAMEITGLSEAT